jgi:hypothetical protein
MNIGNLTKSVVDLWQFVSPPIWLLFFVLAVFAFINRIRIACLFSEINTYTKQIFSVVRKEGTSEKTNWFYTIITAFILLSILHITEVSSSFIGNILPPNLTYKTDTLFAWYTDEDSIRLLSTQYPEVFSISALNDSIEARISELSKNKDKAISNIKHWEEQSSNYILRLNRIKFLALIGLLSFCAGRRFRPNLNPSFMRLTATLLVLAVIGAHSSAMYFFSVEQQEHARNRFLFSESIKADEKSTRQDQEISENLIRLFKDYIRLRSTRWYEVRIIDNYFPRWFYRTFWGQPSDEITFPKDIRDAAEKKGLSLFIKEP